MKVHRLTLLTSVILFTAFALPAEALVETFSTGKDWEKHMSSKEKIISLVPPSLLLNRHDIVTRFTLPEYVQAIDYVMPLNPELGKEEVSNIFVSMVYLLEPEKRPAIENMELQLLRGEQPPKLLRFRFEQPTEK